MSSELSSSPGGAIFDVRFAHHIPLSQRLRTHPDEHLSVLLSSSQEPQGGSVVKETFPDSDYMKVWEEGQKFARSQGEYRIVDVIVRPPTLG